MNAGPQSRSTDIRSRLVPRYNRRWRRVKVFRTISFGPVRQGRDTKRWSRPSKPRRRRPSRLVSQNRRISATTATSWFAYRNHLTSAYPCSDGIGTFRERRCRAFQLAMREFVSSGDLPSEITPQVFRHSFASLAADLGFGEATIASLIEHKAHSITSRYIHSGYAGLLAAANAVANAIWKLMEGKNDLSRKIGLIASTKAECVDLRVQCGLLAVFYFVFA
jgi:hypothetical protein